MAVTPTFFSFKSCKSTISSKSTIISRHDALRMSCRKLVKHLCRFDTTASEARLEHDVPKISCVPLLQRCRP